MTIYPTVRANGSNGRGVSRFVGHRLAVDASDQADDPPERAALCGVFPVTGWHYCKTPKRRCRSCSKRRQAQKAGGQV